MPDLAFVGNRIKLFADLRQLAYRDCSKLLFDVQRQGRWRREQPEPAAAESIQQGIVVELRDYIRTQGVGFKPLLDPAADGVIACRKQQGRAIQAGRKSGPTGFRQCGNAEQRDVALTQHVAEYAQGDSTTVLMRDEPPE